MTEPRRPIVLCLDDDELWLRALARALRARGARVVACTEPEQLFEALEGGIEPTLYVIDYVLGDGANGGEVARGLRERLEDAAPPLVLLSGTLEAVSPETRDGFALALSKAADLPWLVDSIMRLTREAPRPQSHQRLRAAVDPGAAPSPRRRKTTPM